MLEHYEVRMEKQIWKNNRERSYQSSDPLKSRKEQMWLLRMNFKDAECDKDQLGKSQYCNKEIQLWQVQVTKCLSCHYKNLWKNKVTHSRVLYHVYVYLVNQTDKDVENWTHYRVEGHIKANNCKAHLHEN